MKVEYEVYLRLSLNVEFSIRVILLNIGCKFCMVCCYVMFSLLFFLIEEKVVFY